MKDYKMIKNYRTGGNCKVLFCFPYAGGGAPAYRDWIRALDNKVNICPIQLPGREERIIEKPYTDMYLLANNLADTIENIIGEKKCSFFGHSMGGKIAYETALELSRRGKNIERMFVSGCEAPHIPITNPIFNLPDEEFKKEIISFEGTPKELCEHKELFDFFLPLLRGDFTLVETYQAKGKVPIPCPITALYGTEDREASFEEVIEWKNYTKASFDVNAVEGGHFFIKSNKVEVWNNILNKIKID